MSIIRTEAQWRRDGAPHELARPIAEIHGVLTVIYGAAAVARAVGTLGDEPHLSAEPPEDHCPYSQTGWPGLSRYPFIHALDDGLPGFERRFRYFLSEKRIGRSIWVKYINLDGWHYAFQPTEHKTASSDSRKHGHLSIRTDWVDRSIAYRWNTVRKGAHGAGVVAVQQMANTGFGYSLRVDGVFGSKTDKAVRQIQALRQLTDDGIVGPKTRVTLAVAR